MSRNGWFRSSSDNEQIGLFGGFRILERLRRLQEESWQGGSGGIAGRQWLRKIDIIGINDRFGKMVLT